MKQVATRKDYNVVALGVAPFWWANNLLSRTKSYRKYFLHCLLHMSEK